MKKILSILIIGTLLALSACQSAQTKPVEEQARTSSDVNINSTQDNNQATSESKKDTSSDDEIIWPQPDLGQVLKTSTQNPDVINVKDFISTTQEKGIEYWKGKSILLKGVLTTKPDIILHKDKAGERADIPAASIAESTEKNAKFVGFFMSVDINNYLIEKCAIGDTIELEFPEILSIKEYDNGYHLNAKVGPNLIVSQK